MTGIAETIRRYNEPLNLDIDMHALDEEWVRQPRMFMCWAAHASDCAAAVDNAKAALALVESELDVEVRRSPESYGIIKATEASVAAAIQLAPRHKAAVERLNAARHEHGLAAAAVDALEHRKRALENIVVLQGREYYATPRAPQGEGGQRMKEAEKREVRSRGVRNE